MTSGERDTAPVGAVGDLERLVAATSGLTGVLDREQVGRVLVEQTMAAVGADAAGLYVLNERSGSLVHVASAGWPDELEREFERVGLGALLPLSKAANREEPVLIGSRRVMTERFPELVRVQERTGSEAWAAVPLLSGGRLLGGVRLTYRSEQAFTPPQRALLMAIGRQYAQALDGVMLHESEAAARRQADQLLRIVEVAQAAESLDELLDAMLEPLREMTGADRAVAFLRNELGDLEVRSASGLTPAEASREVIPWGAGIAGKTAATGTARVVDDVRSAGPVSTYLQAGGSLIQVPLRAERNVPVGVLEVSSRQVAAFEESQMALLELAAERLSVAIERASVHDAVAAARAQAEALLRIAEVALAANSLEELLSAMLEPLRDVTRADRAVVFLHDEHRRQLQLRAAVGLNAEEAAGIEVPWGKGIAGTVAASGRARVVNDLVSAGPVSAYLRRGGSLIGVPLRSEAGPVMGVLEVSSRRLAAFQDDQVAVLELAAERLSVAIERATTHDRQREIAITLQRSMLPRQLPDLPNVQLATRYLAGSTGTEVGGDWYDAFEINSGQIGLAVGDVIGKGMHAAATMGQLRNALRIFGLEGLEPQQAVGRLNELTNSPESAFATVVYATFDPGSRLLSYTCAGHPPPLCVTTTGAVRYLAEGRGLPLGADEATQYEQANATLSPGDLLILYTDGLVENRRDSLDARLIRLASIPTTGAADLDHLLDNILYEMAEAEHFTDDVAILALRT